MFLGLLLAGASLCGLTQDAPGQVLPLPPRPADALTGSQFTNVVGFAALADRENWIYAQVLAGNVPGWMRALRPVSVTAPGHTATYHVLPDYLAVGSDSDYFLCPVTPLLAQRLADRLGFTLPTRRMANQIWTNAAVKLNPQTIAPSPEMTTVPIFAWHNHMVRTQRNLSTNSFPLGALVAGGKKDVILSTKIYTNFSSGVTKPVVIYGWHYPSGSPIQPLYNGHGETYADYSHGARLVQMSLTVDGAANTVSNVLKNATLAPLLSDEGAAEGSANGTIQNPRYTTAPLAPAVLIQPRNRSVYAGQDATFTTLSAGDAPMAFQWRVDGAPLPGATNATLSLTNVQSAAAGHYALVASNAAGAVTSRVAVLRVRTNAFPLLFADDFEIDSSPNWSVFWGAANGVADHTVDWAFEHGASPHTFNGLTTVIPPAPNSPDGDARAVRLTVNNNDAIAATAAVNLYPKNQFFSGDFAVKFDLWINYSGNAGGTGGGVTGSTEHGIFGINHLGTNANWAAPSATASDGVWFAASGEGGDSRDYRSYVGNLSGTQTDLTGSASSGLVGTNNSHAVFQSLFPASRFETAGAPGKSWVEVELHQVGGVVTWLMNGEIIARRTNASPFTAGNLMLGLMDTFSSIAGPARDSFVLFDNVRVENLSPPPVRIAGVSILAGGAVSLTVTSAPNDTLWLDVSADLDAWQPLAILTTTNATVTFVDTTAPAHAIRYYRARR